jgi:hypothetical protein
MDKTRLLELAGVQLNEGMNDTIIDYIANIIIKTVKSDDYFSNMDKEKLNDEIEEMVVEQFNVLKEDLFKSVIEKIQASVKGK